VCLICSDTVSVLNVYFRTLDTRTRRAKKLMVNLKKKVILHSTTINRKQLL